MKVALEKSFPMPGDVQTVWGVLQNIEGVAGCMPGAKITERIDDTHFKGTVAVKVGPASMSFKGDIEVRELDAAKHTLRLIGKGSDTSGTSGATMDLTARVEAGAEAGSSNLIGISEVTMSGKAAAFGGRMMGSVADQILKQFAGNFGKKVAAAVQVAQAAPATMVTASAAAPPVEVPTLAPVSTPSQSVPTSAGANSAEPENKLNALALVWAIIRDGFRNLFRRKPA
jgi:carbon monoxide dehydrogenase subunit G